MTYDEKLIKILTTKERISLLKTTIETLITEHELFSDFPELLNVCNKLSLKREQLSLELDELVKSMEGEL